MRPILLVALLLALVAPSAGRADTPFQFAAPGLRAPDDPHVNGLRFTAIHGKNRSVRGLDFGVFAVSETGDMTGFRSIMGVGRLRGDMSGCASAFVNLHEGTDRGLNVAFLNLVRRMSGGANLAFVNIVDDYSTTDLGGLNVSDRSAVQVGFLNITERIDGVQLGFLNLAENGFLPVFPFFNFSVD